MTGPIVGIDLGTTHSALAYADADADPTLLAIPQVVGKAEVDSLRLLPSALYAPAPHEPVPDPWAELPWVVGKYARERSAETEGRGVASAKSWLSHTAVDRQAPILPWGIEDADCLHLSPVEASTRVLAHLARAWDATFPQHPLGQQQVVLTVPASFDQVARRLTVAAAREAGLSVRLLEEPTAAFYALLAKVGESSLRELVAARGQAQVLVVDVGGGTTDLTLIRLEFSPSGRLSAERTAVGRHLLLGGDNLDLALAHLAERRLSPAGTHLPPQRFVQLVQACRVAKEKLLAEAAPDSAKLTLAARGSQLVGGTLSTELGREEVATLALDGFVPQVARSSAPQASRVGLRGFGLPYESDPAITRHLASFLTRHLPTETPLSAVLLNGGVFHAPALRARLLQVLQSWQSQPVSLLQGADPDLAVALGAVTFGQSLQGRGLRIGGGSAHGYYVGVQSPGEPQVMCVVPRGAREGERHLATRHRLALLLGKPARFEPYALDQGPVHAPGSVVPLTDDFEHLPALVAHFEASEPVGERRAPQAPSTLEVVLEGELSAIGTLDLACVAADDPSRRFELAFELRGQETEVGRQRNVRTRSVQAQRIEDAADAIQRVFGKGRSDVAERAVKDLVRNLETLLGERKGWDGDTTRALFDVLAPKHRARKRSLDHERVFWMLSGFCLRPGFGHPLDPQRVALLTPLLDEGLTFPAETRGWQQWWIAWRRIAGGMPEGHQARLLELIEPFVAPEEAKLKRRKGWAPLAAPEMLECASFLERPGVQRKQRFGGWLLERTWTSREPALWSALGRVGARVPTYASHHHVVGPRTVERWLDHLLRERWQEMPTAARAAAQMARRTGDRARDVSEDLRERVATRLRAEAAAPGLLAWVEELVAMNDSERALSFGEELPSGLLLLSEDD